MKCVKVVRLLNRYIDKEIKDQAVNSLIEQHLDKCYDCKKQLSLLSSIKGLLAQREAIGASEEFLIRLRQRLEPQAQLFRIRWLPQAGSLARRLIPVPVLTAALIFVLMLGQLKTVNPVDEYIFSDLSTQEIAIVGGYIDSGDLLESLI